MSERVKMPALGESVTEGTVTRWLKGVGDSVDVDEPCDLARRRASLRRTHLAAVDADAHHRPVGDQGQPTRAENEQRQYHAPRSATDEIGNLLHQGLSSRLESKGHSKVRLRARSRGWRLTHQ